MYNNSKALDDILNERQVQVEKGMNDFDKSNTKNDWVAYIVAYAGRAANKVLRNERENQTFRDNMVKTGALALAAIESFDKGNC